MSLSLGLLAVAILGRARQASCASILWSGSNRSAGAEIVVHLRLDVSHSSPTSHYFVAKGFSGSDEQHPCPFDVLDPPTVSSGGRLRASPTTNEKAAPQNLSGAVICPLMDMECAHTWLHSQLIQLQQLALDGSLRRADGKSHSSDDDSPGCISGKSRSTTVRLGRRVAGAEREKVQSLSASQIWLNSAMSLLCVCVAAMAAGLTMGMLSIDPLFLQIKIRCGTDVEKKQAVSILPLIQQHHLLLVTLLLLNSAANEALPLFLDQLVPSYVAVIFSVTLVLIFGEIIPSAIFTGPNQIRMASFMSPIVKIFMLVLSPLAWPIAKTLDAALGHDDQNSLYNRMELSALVRIMYEQERAEKQRQREEAQLAIGNANIGNTPKSSRSERCVAGAIGGALSSERKKMTESSKRLDFNRTFSIHVDEVSMVEGALKMRTRFVRDVFTPMQNVFAVQSDLVLSEDTINMIYSSGYSRVPVYTREAGADINDKSGICALLMTRQLIVVDAEMNRPLSSMPLVKPITVHPDTNMVDLLNIFQHRGPEDGHLAVVCRHPNIASTALAQDKAIPCEAEVLGVVSLEDVLEQLLQENIVDENDRLEHVALRRARVAIGKWKGLVRNNKLERGEPIPAYTHVDVASSDSQLLGISPPKLRTLIEEARSSEKDAFLTKNGNDDPKNLNYGTELP